MQLQLQQQQQRNAKMEEQLRTFLHFNNVVESDLQKSEMQTNQLKKQLMAVEEERDTLEAYYLAKLEEMQHTFDALVQQHRRTGDNFLT